MDPKRVLTHPTFKESKTSGESRVPVRNVSKSNNRDGITERNNEVRTVK